MASRRGSVGTAAVHEPADALDLDDHLVAVGKPDGRLAECADACRRARGDDVARFEREGIRTVADDLGDAEIQVGRASRLSLVAIDEATDGEVRRVADLIAADDDGTDRAERVERLATGPLPVPELEVACRDVVEAR